MGPWYRALLEEEDDDPVQAVVDRLLDTPQVTKVVDEVRDFLNRAAHAIESPPEPRRAPVRQRVPHRPPAAPRRPRSPIPTARTIMHFGADEPLTKEKISKRRRELAAICHPDKGGSTRAMAQLNRAAELLIASLK